LVVDSDELAANMVSVLETIQVEQYGLDLGLAVNQQATLAGSGFVAHRDVLKTDNTLPSNGKRPPSVVKMDALLGQL
jgi:hypothetical protein